MWRYSESWCVWYLVQTLAFSPLESREHFVQTLLLLLVSFKMWNWKQKWCFRTNVAPLHQRNHCCRCRLRSGELAALVPCPPFVSLAGSPPDLLLHTTEQQHCTTHVGQKACCQNIHYSHWQSSVLITWPTPSFSGPPTQQARSHANQFNMSQEWAGSEYQKIQCMCDSILPHSQLWAWNRGEQSMTSQILLYIFHCNFVPKLLLSRKNFFQI